MAQTNEQGRSGWDLVFGGLMIVGGIIVLSNVVIATAVSVLFLGWTALLAGVAGLVISLFRVRKEGFWSALLGSGLVAVLGLVMVRNPSLTAVSLTLVTGAVFLTTGVARIAAAFHFEEARVPLLIGGGLSTLLGLVVLFNLFTASLTLLGILLGIQMLTEGVAVMVAGRGAFTPRFRGQPATS
jgi:uncharacterized membrane protein HdeD (DUF308 family)